MNRQEYEQYCADVEDSLKGLEFVSSGPRPGCEECGTEDISGHNEIPEGTGSIEFTWRECEVCNRSLGGAREPVHGRDKDSIAPYNLVHLDACPDCVYFIEYGQLDDMTMLEIEDSD